jgi:hypothetical protein
MFEGWMKREPTYSAFGLFMGLSLLLTLPAYGLEDRLFQGANVWGKTIKFQLALSVYFLSLAFFAQWAPASLLNNPRYRIYAVVVCGVTLAEILWIGGASAHGIASHYNRDSLIMAVIYPLMGIFATILTSASFVLGRAIWKDQDSRLDPSMRMAIGGSLMLTCVLTLITAGTLSAFPGHHIGTPLTGARVPLVGWSREVGDLRVAHFFATHALHVLPCFGVLVLGLKRTRLRQLLVLGAGAVYTGFVMVLFVQALRGLPVLPAL